MHRTKHILLLLILILVLLIFIIIVIIIKFNLFLPNDVTLTYLTPPHQACINTAMPLCISARPKRVVDQPWQPPISHEMDRYVMQHYPPSDTSAEPNPTHYEHIRPMHLLVASSRCILSLHPPIHPSSHSILSTHLFNPFYHSILPIHSSHLPSYAIVVFCFTRNYPKTSVDPLLVLPCTPIKSTTPTWRCQDQG